VQHTNDKEMKKLNTADVQSVFKIETVNIFTLDTLIYLLFLGIHINFFYYNSVIYGKMSVSSEEWTARCASHTMDYKV